MQFKISSQEQLKIQQNFRYLVETVIKQPSILAQLYESEIKDYFKGVQVVELKVFSSVFQKYTQKQETIFSKVVQRICSVQVEEERQQISLKEEERTLPSKKCPLVPFVLDLVSMLQNEFLRHLDKKTQKSKKNYVFSDLFLADLIFFQLLPRYQMLYLTKSRDNKFFTVLAFEKTLSLYLGYLSFFEPLLYDSHFLIKNDNGELQPVTRFILH